MTFPSSMLVRKPKSAVRLTPHIPAMTRSFVETGDERCPIAGIWSRLTDTDPTLDEPEIARPAMRTLLPWRASHPLFKVVRYSTY